MHTATVSSKGWVVIPKPPREEYSIEKGTRVQVVEALHGILKGGSSLTEELRQDTTADWEKVGWLSERM